jgi:hypothetical protein
MAKSERASLPRLAALSMRRRGTCSPKKQQLGQARVISDSGQLTNDC